MIALLVASALVIAVLLSLTVRVRRRPPDMTELGLERFRKGLCLACISSSTLAAACLLWMLVDPHSLTPNPLWVLLAFGGSVCNAVGLFCCLRELSGESLFAALFSGAAQLLWLWYGIMVMIWNDF